MTALIFLGHMRDAGMSKASLHHSIQQAAKLKDEPSAQQIAADLMGLANPEGLPEEPVTDPVSEGPFEPVGKPLRRSISVKLGVKTEAPSRETGAGGSAAQSGDAGDSAQPHAGISQVWQLVFTIVSRIAVIGIEVAHSYRKVLDGERQKPGCPPCSPPEKPSTANQYSIQFALTSPRRCLMCRLCYAGDGFALFPVCRTCFLITAPDLWE